MKKSILLAFAILPTFSFAQLVMTPEGIKGADSREFVVLETGELSQEEIYQKSLTFLNGMYNSPKDAISAVENSSITVNGFQPEAIRSQYKRLKHTYDLRYSITLEFKEGKVKFQVNSWEAGALINVGDFKPLKDYYGVYNDQLQLQNEAAKNDLEGFFNEFLALYETKVLKSSNW